MSSANLVKSERLGCTRMGGKSKKEMRVTGPLTQLPEGGVLLEFLGEAFTSCLREYQHVRMDVGVPFADGLVVEELE